MRQSCRIDLTKQAVSRPGKIIAVAVFFVFASVEYSQGDWNSEGIQGTHAHVGKTNGSDLRIIVATIQPQYVESQIKVSMEEQDRIASSREDFERDLQDMFRSEPTAEPEAPPTPEPETPTLDSRPPPPPVAPTPGAGAGNWFIILGSFPHAAIAEAQARVDWLVSRGINARLIDTNSYPNLTDGLHAIVLGPFDKSEASRLLTGVKGTVGDAYIKSGY